MCPVVPQIRLNIPLQSKDTQYGHVTCPLMTWYTHILHNVFCNIIISWDVKHVSSGLAISIDILYPWMT